MDVTSLLNANAAEQQKKGDGSKTTPTRNRTPWDAGGYALPINTLSSVPMATTLSSSSTTRTSTPPQANVQIMQEQEITHEAPSSPKHKFSDSRSSLSSFSSSLQSASHSRFSSLSTVGSLQQVNSIDEALSRPKKHSFDLGHTVLQTMEASRPSPTGAQSRGSISPTSSMEALVLAAEKHSVSQRPSASRNISTEDSSMSQSTEKPSSPSGNDFAPGHRPSSPSDAILIKRSAVPSLRVNTSDQDLRASDDVNITRTYLSAPLDHHLNSLINTRGHKRAISAPDFSGLTNNSFTMSQVSNLSISGPRPDPTPPRSTHPDNDSPISPTDLPYPAPDTPPANNTEPGNDTALRCMFVDNCNTDSQLRKAISHIFGRNKMCTRQIPDEVWVHYCRKHYQRSRYRDPKRFVKVQSDLVLQQIHQIHDWSEQNRLSGRPGVVESWGLAVRKREQKRLDDLSSNRKRNSSTLDGEVDAATGVASTQPHTAVPDWMLDLTGTGYATGQMLEIFGRLQDEVAENKHMSFPDVEILPNIIVNQDEPKSPKGYTKRNSGGGGPGHKRAQSLGVNMKSDYFSASRRSSQPNAWAQDSSSHSGSAYGSPIQKRRRGNDLSEHNSPVPPFRNHLNERSLEAGGRRIPSFSQQSMYNIAEHEVASDRFIQQAPLPAPVAQRLGGQTMANHLEDSQFVQVRRPIHQRSQSDMGAFSRGHLGYPQAPSSVYAPEMQTQFGRPAYHEQPRMVSHQYHAGQPQWEPIPTQSMHSGYPQRSMSQHQSGFASSHHQRVQSTPMVPMGYGPSAGQHFSHASNYPDDGTASRTMEDHQSRNLFAARR